jgi:hypothetical protein
MSSLMASVEGYAALLKRHKIRATLDPRNVVPPCVLLNPPSLTLDLNCGGTASYTAHVIAPGAGNTDAWKLLDEMTAKVVGILNEVESIEPTSVSVDGTGDMPAFLLSWSASVDYP